MEGAYLFLLIIILSGYLFTKNIGINRDSREIGLKL